MGAKQDALMIARKSELRKMIEFIHLRFSCFPRQLYDVPDDEVMRFAPFNSTFLRPSFTRRLVYHGPLVTYSVLDDCLSFKVSLCRKQISFCTLYNIS